MIAAGGAPLNIADGLREFARASLGAAVIDEGRQATYAAVDERSNRLASAMLAAQERRRQSSSSTSSGPSRPRLIGYLLQMTRTDRTGEP